MYARYLSTQVQVACNQASGNFGALTFLLRHGRAKEIESGKIFALKKIKMERETEGFPLTSIREINILLALHHKNIVNVTEVCRLCAHKHAIASPSLTLLPQPVQLQVLVLHMIL